MSGQPGSKFAPDAGWLRPHASPRKPVFVRDGFRVAAPIDGEIAARTPVTVGVVDDAVWVAAPREPSLRA